MHYARILANEGHTQKEIASRLGVSDRMVRNYLNPNYGTTPRKQRTSILSPFHQFIEDRLEDNPFVNLVPVYEQLQQLGYSGGMTILRDFARIIRKKLITKAVRRFETEPGRQAQVDWKECGYWSVDGVPRKLYAFVMLLGYSRRPFILFTTDMTEATLLQAHLLAFAYFGAVPQEILYDNMKTAWIHRAGGWYPNAKLLELASACGFTPKRCQVRRPQTKGKVERFIGYLAHNYLPRPEVVSLNTLEDLNDSVLQWMRDVDQKQVSGFRKTRLERFAEELPQMTQWIPEAAPDVRLQKELLVSREGTVQYQTNRYSVDARHIGQIVTLKANTITRAAELIHDGVVCRSLTLLPKGAHSRDIREEDHRSLMKRWNKENRPKQKAKKVKQKASEINQLMNIPVDVGDPVRYDSLMAGAL